MADGAFLGPPYLERRYERLTGGPEARRSDYVMRRVLHERLGMTLEAFKALPWYVADSIEEGLTEEFGGDGEQFDLSTNEGLKAAGFDVREVS